MIEVNPQKLADYLESKSSIFSISCISDFFETLQVLQFSKHLRSYSFVNPNFQRDTEVTDDFYKQAIDILNVNDLKGTKRMSPLHHINLFSRLQKMFNRKQHKTSRREFAQMKLRYFLQQQVDSMRYEENIVEFKQIDMPDYVQNKEIAGYYGNVEMSALKRLFLDYFPIYQDTLNVEAMEVDSLSTYQPVEAVPDLLTEIPSNLFQPAEPEMNREQSEMEVDVVVDECSKAVTGDCDENGSDKENQPPKKRRKCIKRSSKVTATETNDALMNLQKEFDALETLDF